MDITRKRGFHLLRISASSLKLQLNCHMTAKIQKENFIQNIHKKPTFIEGYPLSSENESHLREQQFFWKCSNHWISWKVQATLLWDFGLSKVCKIRALVLTRTGLSCISQSELASNLGQNNVLKSYFTLALENGKGRGDFLSFLRKFFCVLRCRVGSSNVCKEAYKKKITIWRCFMLFYTF